MTVPVSILAGLFCGAVIGGLFVYVILRFQAGGKSGAAVRKELEQYQSEVDEHFDKTSELFADMTDQYRALYEHLSTDARNLTGKDSIAQALGASRVVLPDSQAKGQLEDNRSMDETDVAGDPAAIDAGQIRETGLEVNNDGAELPTSTPEIENTATGTDDYEDSAADSPLTEDDQTETPGITDRR